MCYTGVVMRKKLEKTIGMLLIFPFCAFFIFLSIASAFFPPPGDLSGLGPILAIPFFIFALILFFLGRFLVNKSR